MKTTRLRIVTLLSASVNTLWRLIWQLSAFSPERDGVRIVAFAEKETRRILFTVNPAVAG
jgi:predicted DNA-binding transcriptional regulator AlpA